MSLVTVLVYLAIIGIIWTVGWFIVNRPTIPEIVRIIAIIAMGLITIWLLIGLLPGHSPVLRL